MSSHDARKTIDGHSRSTTGVETKKNGSRNASSVNIRGQSKSSTAISKLCRERNEWSPARATSKNSVRPRTQPSNRNLSRTASKTNENGQTVSRTASKTREGDRHLPRSLIKSKESARNLSRLSPKGKTSDRNLFRLPPRSKESDHNLSHSPPKTKKSDRNLPSLPSRGRESDRNVSRSASKTRKSDRNIPRLPLKSRDTDRNLSRPVSNAKGNERNVTRPTTTCRDIYRSLSRSTKGEKSRDVSRPLPKPKDGKQTISSPRAPASTASVSGLIRGQPSVTRFTDRTKPSALSLKSKGIPLLSTKLLSHLSLKKLSSFAFRKKATPTKTAGNQNESSAKSKGKDRPRSAGIALSTSRLDEATQSSEQWAESEETFTRPSQEYLGTKPVSEQQGPTDQRHSSRPVGRPDRAEKVAPSKSFKDRRSDQNVLVLPKISAGRLEPTYQQQDIFSLESFTEYSERSTSRQEHECRPEDSTQEQSVSVHSGESSSTKPKQNNVISIESSAAESFTPKQDNVCSPEMSICEPRGKQGKQPDVRSLESLTGELNRLLQQDSVVRTSASQKHLDSLPKKNESGVKKIKARRDLLSSIESTTEKLPKPDDSGLNRTKSEALCLPTVIIPPKKTESILKRATSLVEHTCAPTVSFQNQKAIPKKDPSSRRQDTLSAPAIPERQTTKTFGIATKKEKSKEDASSILISECLMDAPPKKDSQAREPAKEPPGNAGLEKDDGEKGMQSKPGLQAVDKLGRKDDMYKRSKAEHAEPPPHQAPVICPAETSSTEQTISLEESPRGQQMISQETLAQLKRVCSSIPQGTVTAVSESSAGVAQYELYPVQEGTELQSDGTATLDALCSITSQESLPVFNRGVSKPPPADLLCYPEESSGTGEGGEQSFTETVQDSDGSSLSKHTAPIDKPAESEKASTVQEEQAAPVSIEADSSPSKCGVRTLLDRMPLVKDCKCNQQQSENYTKTLPNQRELSPDAPCEKERFVKGADPEHKSAAHKTMSSKLPPEKEQPSARPPLSTTKLLKPPLEKEKTVAIAPSHELETPKPPSEKEKLRRSESSNETSGIEESTSTSIFSMAPSCDSKEPTVKPSGHKTLPDQVLLPGEQLAKEVLRKSHSAQQMNGEEPPRRPTNSDIPPKESSADSPSKDRLKSNSDLRNGFHKIPPDCDGNRATRLPQRRSTAESKDSIVQTLSDQAEASRAEEGTAARCEPISKLKLKKHNKESAQSDLRDIQEDIRIWKDLYAGCLERLRSLQQMNQAPVRATERTDRAPDYGSSTDRALRRTSNNGQCNLDEIKGGMDEAVRVLETEYGQVESALRKHSAVLAELVSVLQDRMTTQPDVRPATENGEADTEAIKDVKDSIHYLKALITENETLTMQLAAERAKQQVLRQVQVTNDVVDESISATEDKLHRTNSLLKMQMKRLQYEISRLTEAQNIEIKAGAILVDQAEADVKNDRETLNSLQESNERLHELLSSKRFVSGQRVFKRGSRGSFLSEETITNAYCSFRLERLECRVVISDRVQRNVELSNDEIAYLHNLGRRMCNQISETNEEIRKSEFAWLQLRKERDELTKDLYPDLERLQKMQDVAKEKLDLESKLRKENMLFRHQLEEFQKDLLEVETELMSGAITRRTEATKNKVLELETLYETAKLHNAKLREECDSKNLTISRHDSLASLSIDEEEFQRQISEKIQRMELRIQADMDRRLLRPKRYVFEAPGKAKVSFRGQRNVIRAPKNVAEWRRKREAPPGTAEPPKPQQPKDAQELRREILAKLAEEKERAKEQLLRYEAHQVRHAADSTAEPNAQELNELLGRLGRFLNQTRGQEPSPARSTNAPAETPSLHGGEFGETLMHLIVQLDQLQSALTGEESRRRTVRTNLASERHRELLDTLPDASKRGSGNSNPTRNNNNGNNNNGNNS